MFRDYSKLDEKTVIESNCTYDYKFVENFDDFVIVMKLPNGAGVLLKGLVSINRTTNCPYYSPKSKWYFRPSDWKEITPEEAYKLLNRPETTNH